MAAKINWHRYGTIIMSPYVYPFNGIFSWTSWVSQYGTRKVKPVWILDLNDARDGGGLGMAVASAGPHANNLHPVPGR